MTRRASLERRLRDELHSARPPRAAEAERRAWHVVSAAHAAHAPAPPRRRAQRLALAVAAALGATALALTPAGARVGDWIDDAVSPAPAARDSLALPAPGRLLVVGDGSAWVVVGDGGRRRLGDFVDATWSPGGLFVAGARGHELVAVEPDGDERWVRPAAGRVSAPRWSPDGFRVAYLSGSNLRVAIGDNTDDRLLARHVEATPVAWKPLPAPREQVLAFASRGRVRVVAADTRRELGVTPPEPAPREIWWAAGGRRLVTVSADTVRVHSASGRLLRTVLIPSGWVATGSALAPDGRRLALVATAPGARSRLMLVRLDRTAPPRLLFDVQGPLEGLTWSTDGSVLVVGVPRADQWLFVRPQSSRKPLDSVGGIREKFVGGPEPRTGGFPRPAGWCYTTATDLSTGGQRPCPPGSAQ